MRDMKNRSLYLNKGCGCAQIQPVTGSNQEASAPVTGFITRTWDGNDCLREEDIGY